MENNYIYGVKGFDKDLKCRGFQYEVGETYYFKDKLIMCSKGFHFSPKFKYARNFYPFNSTSTSNRFCLVKGKIPTDDDFESILPKSWKHDDKYVTNEITIIREFTVEELIKIRKEEDTSLSLDEIFRIEELKTIQKAYPNFSVGGSVGLYLQGFNIDRENKVSDFDFVIPYFKRLDIIDFEGHPGVTEVDQMDDCKNSGNDFDYTNAIIINDDFILMDMKINPKYRYNIIDYDGFKFKVCPWEVIIQAKMNYLSSSTGKKHKEDLLLMFGNPKPLIKKEEKELPTYETILKEYYNEEI